MWKSLSMILHNLQSNSQSFGSWILQQIMANPVFKEKENSNSNLFSLFLSKIFLKKFKRRYNLYISHCWPNL